MAQSSQLKAVYQRALVLQQRTDALPNSQQALLSQALEELHAVLEELQSSEEELCHQNEELVNTRQAVEVERQRYHELFEFAPDGYLVTDEKGIIQEANAAIATLLQVSQSFLVGKTLLAFVDQTDRSTFYFKLEQLQQVDNLQDWQVRLRSQKRSPFDAELTVSAVRNVTGEVISLRWLLRDITERKQTERLLENVNAELERQVQERTTQLQQALRAKDELLMREQVLRADAQAANRAKDEFLSILSHELRTPLNAILGWLQLLRRQRLNQEKTKQALETIERNAKSQAKLIEDILDISRIITGKLRLQVRPVNLIGVIESAIESMRLAAEAKTIRLQSTLDPSATMIMGDGDRLQQVVWNLLSNAIKFTPTGGQVDVHLKRVESQQISTLYPLQACHATYAEITVSDTGQGINADFLPYVFDRFRQHDSSTTRNFGGLGLGLAIVRQLVELHGGTVRVDSLGSGQGTTFTIKLPMILHYPSSSNSPSSNSLAPAKDGVATLPTLAGLQILVVEDEADALELLSTILQEYGAEVIPATSVCAALAILETSNGQIPDILVSDIGMPHEDGYSLIRKLRELESQRGGWMPAIALTAYASSDDHEQALLAGFQMHLPKPVEAEELATVVARLMGRTAGQPHFKTAP